MKNRIVIITGANSGIGKAATIKFAKEGYTVVMACRNLEKSRKVQQEIIQVTKNEQIDLMELDVSSFESIRNFVSMYENKYQKLDVLIHNAGYFNHGEKVYQMSPDHIELTFATNMIGPFLMTGLLLDMLKKSDDARILNACTTNIRHFFEPKRTIEFDNLRGEYKNNKPYSVYKMYGDSKMALLMVTFRMADLLKRDGIKVNAIQIPAIKISKETMKKFKSLWKVAARIQNLFSDEPETMADTYYHICDSDEFKDITGKLINDERQIVHSSHYKDSFIQSVKQLFDKGVYPKYADNIEVINKVWEFCQSTTKISL